MRECCRVSKFPKFLTTLEKIERSGSDDRWEFDRKKLFDQTDYMAERCADLYEVSQVIEQFHNILGPQLKGLSSQSLFWGILTHTQHFSCHRSLATD